jgi:calcineurin-like phosphoesterase family protein
MSASKAGAQAPVSPFNKRIVSDTSADYSFIVSGHFHGSSLSRSTYPAATLLANLDTLNSMHPVFLMSLGDLFLDVNEVYMRHYRQSLFDKLNFPVFNVVGNHDVSNGNLYEKKYGQTFSCFKIQTELYILLNTEVDDGSIKNEQKKMLVDCLANEYIRSVKNIFIFSHRPIWAERIKKYEKLFVDNTRTAIGKNNFTEEVAPLLKKIPSKTNVFWMSGSLGTGNSSFFFDKEETTHVTYIQTAIRDLPRDAVLKVNVKSGRISFNTISLTGENLLPLEKYAMDYWSDVKSPESSFNFRLLPFLAKQLLTHHFFWIGFVIANLLWFSIKLLKARKNKLD